MATGVEQIGSVGITITGDASPLYATFAVAQGAARAAGANIASGVASGFAGASGLVDQFGRAIQSSVIAPTVAATPVVQKLGNTFKQTAAEGAHSVSEIQAVSGTIRTLDGNQGIRAAERFLTLIPGLAPALQAAFPIIGALALGEVIYRTFEKFTQLSEAQKHLAEVTKQNDAEFDRLARDFERVNVERLTAEFGALAGLHLKGFYDAGSAQDDKINLENVQHQIELAKQTLSDTNSLYSSNGFTRFLQDWNPTILGMRLGEVTSAGTTNTQISKLKELQQAADVLADKLRNAEQQKKKNEEDAARTASSDAGALQGARVTNQQSALSKLSDMAKAVADLEIGQAHAVSQSQINAMHDTQAAAVAGAAEELRVAQEKERRITDVLAEELPKRMAVIRQQGAAESAGKSAPEQQRIGVQTQGKVAEAEAEAAKEAYNLYAATVAAQERLDEANATKGRETALSLAHSWEESYDAITKAAKETSNAQAKATEEAIRTQVRVQEIQNKSGGELAALKIENQKIALERQYGLEVGHTGAQEVAYARQIAALNAEARFQKLEGLEAQLKDAEALTGTLRDEAGIADLKRQIAVTTQENVNADAQDAAKIDEQNQKLTQQLTLQQQINAAKAAAQNTLQNNNQQIGAQIGAAIGNLPKDIGNDIGGAISDALLGHHPGKSIGQEMGSALVNALKQTAGNLLKQLISGGIQFGLAALGFADGGSPPVGVPSIVGERGPELFVPHTAGSIIPNHMLKGYADGAGLSSLRVSHASSVNHQSLTFHVYGARDGKQQAREIGNHIRSTGPGYSVFSK